MGPFEFLKLMLHDILILLSLQDLVCLNPPSVNYGIRCPTQD